ncbi:type II secretion system GspH family protein [Luteolibacter flavescens]|uniref:Type II secretion system GspH family protein n=1 Tax=Luteolibacter flavescens TaxID=1859460 RepID=A0ABT3FWV7_9BACT|nr:type II secretion system protein [Luteolibacter flavescens]MCW1887485.1 type II secretion system GspH family protein [Luteolibacter flavescens]
MKTNTRRQRGGFTLVELLVVIVIIAALAGLSAPVILKQRKKADQTEASQNIRQVHIALIGFEGDYGTFPDNNTAQEVKDSTGSALSFGGTYANDYFRQLIATTGKAESIYWCKTAYSPRKPDNDVSPGKALDKGEVGFGYIMASQTDGLSSSGNSSRPVVVSPLYKAQPNWEFDPEPYEDKAIVLRIDGSAKAETIRTDNRYISVTGGYLQSQGEKSVWDEINPVLRAPEPRGAQ